MDESSDFCDKNKESPEWKEHSASEKGLYLQKGISSGLAKSPRNNQHK
jgi:hypothetical protein